MAGLLDETVRYINDKGTTTFFIRRLGPEQQLDLWEEIRPQLGDSVEALIPFIDVILEQDARSSIADLVNLSTAESRDILISAVKAFIKVPRPVTQALRRDLFPEVLYQKSGMESPNTLHGNVNSAFEFLTAFNILEILVRATAVNFHDSLAAGLLMFDSLEQGSSPPSTPTSIPS